ncbi:sugar-binding transcriptional regulator [Pediococcus claussenii]|uniref:Central glycolytic gene regulator n=1 Tax=Pediococcus claussenii (strain ATCC BAA-344 / DSM 14800 / JCM 18046 / KCTC 3811 / LMG 21948 / P06) TaxID=701521 RepID=G8PC28_PEDCP|nr:sugar-binding domain-containing protein [Pediococcus claussenii]AEV94847.1 central glycolytic gene regulator [Pediococcus claussenii ATCC BAA-344]
MSNQLELLESIVPEMVDGFLRRYDILRAIAPLEPVGRRVLADRVHLSERVLRTETDTLRSQGLIISSQTGMSLTEDGRKVEEGLEGLANQLWGLKSREDQLASKLGIEQCIIVRGNSDRQWGVTQQLGFSLNEALAKCCRKGNNTIVVMGGSTMAAVAAGLTTALSRGRGLLFVPGRGGMGESVRRQANSVAATMASQTGGQSRSLYIPEQLSEDTYHPLLNEPSVKAVMDLIARAQVAIHGIGRADDMARRREIDEKTQSLLHEAHAIGEAFGCFYDKDGKVVYRVPRLGLQLEDAKHFNHVVAIASGSDKAEAIDAYMKIAPKQTVLITDEGAANLILKK